MEVLSPAGRAAGPKQEPAAFLSGFRSIQEVERYCNLLNNSWRI